jgi:pantoate--beta-alanine ligase
MKIIKTKEEGESARIACAGKTVGLVPTMGALHDGHLSLVKKSIAENGATIASIYVNPTQFNNQADLENYPSTFDEDCALLEKAGVDYLFTPDFQDIYPDNYRYRVNETELSGILCGATRPGHFEGVLTVVLKLLNIFTPDRAYFGEKDYQQYLLIKGMAAAFFLRTEIVPCPLVRAESGLALSSRNKRLSPEGLRRAPLFHRHLSSGVSAEKIRSLLEKDGFTVDYIQEYSGRIFAAVFLEEVRLIDNVQR